MDLLTAVNEEIHKLITVRDMLTAGHSAVVASGSTGATGKSDKRRGRPPGSRNLNSVVSSIQAAGDAPKTGGMSAAGRARIAESMKARWAAKRSGAKTVSKKAATKAA